MTVVIVLAMMQPRIVMVTVMVALQMMAAEYVLVVTLDT